MTTRLFFVLGCMVFAGHFSCAAASGQTPLRAAVADPGQYFNQGVHAYFAGQSTLADDLLSRALAVDVNDPRAYYFRGLARLRMGRSQDAAIDMQIGASIEAQQLERFAMGRTLERVQGGERLLLERYRRDGASAAANSRAQVDRTRYEQVAHREAELQHRPASIAIDQLLAAGERPVLRFERRSPPTPAWSMASLRPAPPASAANSTDDPFPDDPVAQPSSAPVRGSIDRGPALSAPPSPPASADDNPFGGSAPAGATPNVASPPATTPAPSSDNPFDNPFGG